MSTSIETAQSPSHFTYQDGEQLGEQITELSSYIYAATYRLLVMIREFDNEGYWQMPGLCSCAHWLNFKCGIGMNAAREKVRVAHALADLPKISKAFEKGELSYSKARAMTRVATRDNEDYLMMIAYHGTAYHMEKLVQRFRRAERLQDAVAANRQYRDRYLEHHYDDDGCLVITARLPAEQGALVVKALEKAMEDQYERAIQVPVCVSAETPETDDTEPAPDSIAARRADAAAEVAETYLNGNDRTATTADRYQVVVHVSAETSDDSRSVGRVIEDGFHVSAETSAKHRGPDAYIENGPNVSAETSRRIACDSSIIGLTEDEYGEPLSIGRKTRSIPPAIRRALRFRDKGCRFPGCTNTRFVDGHHIEHWADGGETSLDNLVQLCRHHHRLVHEGGFTCERMEGSGIEFRNPAGNDLLDLGQTRPGLTHDLEAWLHVDDPDAEIDAQTCVPMWCGERMDWDLAVAALFESPR